jgi:hypothetical protein
MNQGVSVAWDSASSRLFELSCRGPSAKTSLFLAFGEAEPKMLVKDRLLSVAHPGLEEAFPDSLS